IKKEIPFTLLSGGVLLLNPRNTISLININKTPPDNNMKGISFLIVCLSTFNGYKNAATPTISDVFNILLLTILPMDISELLLIAAIILTVASGALVPKATIVKPTSSGDILIRCAIPEAPSTKKSAPLINNAKPITSIK